MTRPGEDVAVLGAAAADPDDVTALGAKGAGLLRMARAGLPVPPAFILPTSVCAVSLDEGGLSEQACRLVDQGVRHLEQRTGTRFGAARRPLLLSARSGAPVSMPGMLYTVVDLGLTDDTLPGLLRLVGDPAFVWDTYRRLVQSYAHVVDGCPTEPFAEVLGDALRRQGVPSPDELDADALRGVADAMRGVYRSLTGRPFPQDPREQLLSAVAAVLRSWDSPRAVQYRRLRGIPGVPGTAVTVQAMVFGNTGAGSGAGVGFTRDPSTGAEGLYVDFLPDAQGEDVVSGSATVRPDQPLPAAVPGLPRQLDSVRHRLEDAFGDVQDFEFAVQDGTLWMLQTRTATRTPWAALRIACDLEAEGLIDRDTALERLRRYDLDAIERLELAPGPAATPLGQGIPTAAGIGRGRVALDLASARSLDRAGHPVVLVRGTAATADLAGMPACRGLVTAAGSRTSHAAVVARQLGVACVVGVPGLAVDTDARRASFGATVLRDGDEVTVDGTTGTVHAGILEVVRRRPTDLVERVRSWQRAARATDAPVTREG